MDTGLRVTPRAFIEGDDTGRGVARVYGVAPGTVLVKYHHHGPTSSLYHCLTGNCLARDLRFSQRCLKGFRLLGCNAATLS